MNGSHIVSNSEVGFGGAGYQIVGVGDFNGDGRSDILWSNPNSGDTWMWLMNGAQVTRNSEVGVGGAGYQIVGAGAPAGAGSFGAGIAGWGSDQV